ncbi:MULTISPECIES: nucleoside 2-deoxyribosyltransferase [Anaerococcus]|uniref:nucleoside 2-deoxyribosyltransferase n=1 Tax=Anaerococcus TaxID=165779 RepID=UPI0008A50B7F|nr:MULTISPECIES: nucleoside 2-deoxyribosyltransferase [Anaerococcus]MBS6920593.1 nucleoside 2-deoxyribosyltransferase [Anaerococcus vaginalis]MDU1707400.1 nucleoside 2-deoxyribosyltransferase [Anaerococcus vaginalis]MDU1762863.1 nucleoside 2-deoxyribosyltransferase [Anaerococcus vaginalis]MDU4447581.1 nucleoside 2-deoxyribosyltransferase [Anaerococcus vaginalis]MDU5086169.1 nucleoside 2-deoxyribosyltransferase [Anaerococcus vaginalis]
MKIYLGCDLFTEGQRWQALEIQKALENEFSDIEIYNPAQNLEINDKDAGFTSNYDILLADYERLKNADILVGLMDTQDLGLAAEMGIAFEKGLQIFQLYTDIRLGGNDKEDKFPPMKKDIFQNDFLYINKLVTGLSYVDKNGNKFKKPRIYKKKEELIEDLITYIKENK